MKYLIWLLFFVTDVALACEAMTAASLQERLQKEPAEQLVFFASWCASCKKHLTPDQLQKSYFIAAFDEEDAARRAFLAFLGKESLSRCLFDRDGSIARLYAVKALPRVISLKP